MKKLLAIGLMICVVTSAFCINTFAAEFPASDVVFRLGADKSDGAAVLDFLSKDYITLAIAIIGLIATIVSAILIVIDRRKEIKANREKESDKEQQTENNKKGDIL